MSKIVCLVLVFSTNDLSVEADFSDESHTSLSVFVENIQ